MYNHIYFGTIMVSCGLDAWLPAENISTSIREQFQDIKNKHNNDIQTESCRTER